MVGVGDFRKKSSSKMVIFGLDIHWDMVKNMIVGGNEKLYFPQIILKHIKYHLKLGPKFLKRSNARNKTMVWEVFNIVVTG